MTCVYETSFAGDRGMQYCTFRMIWLKYQFWDHGIQHCSFRNMCLHHCCWYGSGIRCPFGPWIRDLGWVKYQDPDPGWTSRIIFLWELRNNFLGWKNLNSLMRIRIRDSGSRVFDTYSGMEKRIRDPQHWFTRSSGLQYSDMRLHDDWSFAVSRTPDSGGV